MNLEELQKHVMAFPESDRTCLAVELLDSLSSGASPVPGNGNLCGVPDTLPTSLKNEKRGAGKFNVAIGLIFLAWTACDLMAGFDGWSSYADISFGLLAIAFIVYGTSQIRAAGGL